MIYSELDPIALSSEMINCKSVSPSGDESIDLLINYLQPLGFTCHKLQFGDVTNLYARKGISGKNLCFAGHVDVVPAGNGWDSDPFNATIKDGYLYGRGAVDMKPAIAAFISATQLIGSGIDGSISLLISGNEEEDSTNGTPKILEWLKARNEKIDDCIVGEPTNPKMLGEMIKIGRRGSITFELTVEGIQGHVAYPELARNPVNQICFILADLKSHIFDQGNEYFPKSNLEVTTIDVGNKATNVIPKSATTNFNIRFNDMHTKSDLMAIVDGYIEKYTADYNLTIKSSFDPFFTPPGELAAMMKDSVEEVMGFAPIFGTEGGTSDARFIHHYCPVIEFGLTNEMAHKTNERVKLKDIIKLRDIYLCFLDKYFQRNTDL